jgi:long-chain fatty acid transport protein
MKKAVMAAALVAASASPAAAGGFAVAEQSASAGGAGGTGAARSDDPSAAWYNPAALVDGAGVRVGAGLTAAMARLHAEAMDASWSESTEGGAAPLPSLQASWAGGDWAAGVSVGIPFGASVEWPEDWAGRHEIIASRILVVRAAPFFGWRRGAWRVAGGLHVDSAEMRVHRSLDFIDSEGDVQLALRGAGLGLHLAAFVRAAERADGHLDIGLTYKSRTRIGLDGEADFTTPDAFSLKAADQEASSTLTLPDRLAAGAAWQRGAWTFLADLELTAWQVRDQVVIDFANQETPDVTQKADWSATVTVRGGAEWRVGPWVARGGLYRDPTPSPASTLSPTSPDSTRLGGSLGFGRALGRAWAVDAFYGYLHLDERARDNPDSMAARYGGHAHLVGAGLRYRQ